MWFMFALSIGMCPKQEDRTHCECWWDGKPCCSCGYDPGVTCDETGQYIGYQGPRRQEVQ